MPQDTLKKLRADMQAAFAVRDARVAHLGDLIAETHPNPVPHSDGTNLDGSITLPDGTKQFPNAPTGPVVNTVPNTTPAVPKEYGVGAVVRFQATEYMVERVGDGVLMINRLNDSPLWLYPSDVVLVTPAP